MKCENCGKEHNGNYGSGRFCSQLCARSFSTKANRKEINKRVSKTLKKNYNDGRVNRFRDDSQFQKKIAQRGANANHLKKLQRFVKIDDDVLDITYGELEEYRKTHPVCEICGAPEIKGHNLARDHDHENKKFRGLLCVACNRKLGWYEKLKDNIQQYLGEQV